MHGNVPGVGGLAESAIKGAVPYLRTADATLDLISEKYNPLNPAFRLIQAGAKEIPGVKKYVDPKIASFRDFITGIPGTGTAGTIAKSASKISDEIIKAPLTIYESLKNSKADEASARDEALTKMFTEEVNGELYISQPTAENRDEVVSGIDLPGNVNAAGVGKYNSRYNFPYDEGKTRQELFEEFLESESGQTLAEEYQYKPAPPDAEEAPTAPTPPLYESPKSPAIKDEDYPLPDIPNSLRNWLGSPASTAGLPLNERQAIIKAELDQYPPVPDQPQTHDPSLPNYKETPPLNYYTFPLGVKPPIIEPQRYESPTADPYQAPKKQAAPRRNSSKGEVGRFGQL